MRRTIVLLAGIQLALATAIYGKAPEPKPPVDEYFVIVDRETAPPTLANRDENTVVLQDVKRRVTELGGGVIRDYHRAFVGIHAKMTALAAQKIQRDIPEVRVVPNGLAYLSDVGSWGIDRIDQRNLPLDNTYTNTYRGKGVNVYVIDSGLRATHQEFTGRVGEAMSFHPDHRSGSDCNSHGTHVAGTILGATSGVAPEATIHAMRVFGCLGFTTYDIIVAAIDWVITNHQKPAVANLSLGGGANDAMDEAIRNLHAAGVTVAVAAGNSGRDACDTSPARVSEALTVAATDRNDARANFSNFGSCVDIHAPGVEINSANIDTDDGYQQLSGTSMASPHVAGVAALLLSERPDFTPDQVAAKITGVATPDVVSDPKGTPNLLLFGLELTDGPMVVTPNSVYVRTPVTNLRLTGMAHLMGIGSLAQVGWRWLTGSEVTGVTDGWENDLIVSDLAAGEHTFEFTATAEDGSSDSAVTTVTVSDENFAPVAHAGFPVEVNEGTNNRLDGRLSQDFDGDIASYAWSTTSGATILNPNSPQTEVSDMPIGESTYSLTVTDADGAQSSSTVSLFINGAPIVDAGPDQNITADHTWLNGSAVDPNGDEVFTSWSQISGPNTASIATYLELSTKVSGLIEGTYVFELWSTDFGLAERADRMQVVVTTGNQPPVVDAGPDIEVTLPTERITLSGTCTDADGHCIALSWSSGAGIQSVNDSQMISELRISDLVPGTYQYTLTGTDNDGTTATDSVSVVVNPAPVL